MIGGRGGEFAAGEAVSPGGMSPSEWNAIPGAAGGEASANAPWDWRKALAAGAAGIPSGARGGSMAPLTAAPMAQTTAQPLDFNIVTNFLQALLQQAGTGGKKGGR